MSLCHLTLNSLPGRKEEETMFAVFTPSRWRRASLDSQGSDVEEEMRRENSRRVSEMVRREEERRKKEDEKKIWMRLEQRIFMRQ